MLPLLGLFLFGLPLFGAIVAGLQKNSFRANCISAVAFIPSFLIQVLCFIVMLNQGTLSFANALTVYGITFFLPLVLHFCVRLLTRFIRTRMSAPYDTGNIKPFNIT